MTRNIVLVTYDSLRADHCGFMGYERDTTPTLDQMAKEGVVYENAVASGVPTISSMTAVMTGEHSWASPEIGFNTEQRDQVTSRPTVAEVLSDSGYSTGGLSPNPPASSYFGFDDGFDWFRDFLAERKGLFERLWHRVFQNSIEGGNVSTYLRLFRNVVQREEVLRPWEAFYEEILQWVRNVPEPYFLWVLLLEPHHPWLPPTEYQRWSSRWDKYQSFKHYWEMLNSDWEPDFEPSVRRRLVNLYDDSIRYGDAFLEELRDDLRDDDPIFIVHADHGEEFGEHGRYGHQPYLYENLIHVPLVVWNTGRQHRVQKPVGLRSLAPTICDLAGASHPFRAQSLPGDQSWVASKVFVEGGRRCAIRTDRGKYIKQRNQSELYRLATDPTEQQDRATMDVEATDTFERICQQDTAQEREVRKLEAACSVLGKAEDL